MVGVLTFLTECAFGLKYLLVKINFIVINTKLVRVVAILLLLVYLQTTQKFLLFYIIFELRTFTYEVIFGSKNSKKSKNDYRQKNKSRFLKNIYLFGFHTPEVFFF